MKMKKGLMNRKILLRVFMITLVFALAWGGVFNAYAQQKKYVFYFPSHIGGADPNMQVWQKAIEDFKALYPVDIRYFATTEFSIESFKQFVETAVAAKPDGIMVPIVDPVAIDEPLRRAIKNGIPVMALNILDPRPFNEKIPYLGFVGEDSLATGRALARRVLQEFAPRKPKRAVAAVALIGHVSLEQRAQGFIAEMGENGVKAERVATDVPETKAKETMTAYIQRNPDVDVIFSTATYNTPWMWDVMQRLRKTKDITLVSVDESPTSLEAVAQWKNPDANVPKALATHAQNMYMQVWYAAEALYIYNRFGMEPPSIIATGPIVIDSGNVKTWQRIVKDTFGDKGYKDNVLW
ncbi:MAG: substrate-binding domain-containing protein [Spirochaetota bacterium]